MKKNRRVKLIMAQAIVSMAIIAASACIFNLFPDKVGIYRSIADRTSFTPLLAPAFGDYLLGLNVWWGLGFVFSIWLLLARRWTPALRWAEAVLGLVGAYALGRLVIAGPFLPVPGHSLVRYLLGFVVLGMLFDTVRKLNKLVDGRWPTYPAKPVGD